MQDGDTIYKTLKFIWIVIFCVPYVVYAIFYTILHGITFAFDYIDQALKDVPIVNMIVLLIHFVVMIVEAVLYLVCALIAVIFFVPEFFCEEKPSFKEFYTPDEKVREEE